MQRRVWALHAGGARAAYHDNDKKIYNIHVHVYSQCAGLIKSILTVYSIIVIDVYT